ncbi:MAG: hypothetical protein IKH84_06070, partial [Ottowia sp.]|nr:hypothetical protein [Ottowia sp.]
LTRGLLLHENVYLIGPFLFPALFRHRKPFFHHLPHFRRQFLIKELPHILPAQRQHEQCNRLMEYHSIAGFISRRPDVYLIGIVEHQLYPSIIATIAGLSCRR